MHSSTIARVAAKPHSMGRAAPKRRSRAGVKGATASSATDWAAALAPIMASEWPISSSRLENSGSDRL